MLCLLALIIHEVGQETKKIDNQPRSKSLNLNLILTSNISTEHSYDVWKLGISVVNFHCMEMRLMTSMLFIFGNDVIFVCLYRYTQSIQKQIPENNLRSKYPEDYLTVDKKGL